MHMELFASREICSVVINDMEFSPPDTKFPQLSNIQEKHQLKLSSILWTGSIRLLLQTWLVAVLDFRQKKLHAHVHVTSKSYMHII